MPIIGLKVCSSLGWFRVFRKLLKSWDTEVGLQSIYPIFCELCVWPAVGAVDDGSIDLFPDGKSVKAVRAEGVKTGKELCFVSAIIIWLCTDPADMESIWGIGIWMKAGH